MKPLIILLLLILLAAPAAAQTNISHLGGRTTRLTAPIYTIVAASRVLSTPALQSDISVALSKAGLSAITPQVNDAIRAGRLTSAALPKGARIEWMAMRNKGQVEVKSNLRWNSSPLQGYAFTVERQGTSYTFFIPEICGNLSLLHHEAMAAPAPPPATIVVQQPAPPQTVIVEVPKTVYVQLPPPAPVVVPVPRYNAYISGHVGMERRQFDSNDPAGKATAKHPLVNSGDPLVVGKFGLNGYLSEHWVVSPAAGAFYNGYQQERNGVFADLTLGYKFSQGTTLAGGASLWDITHHDSMALAYLGTITIPFPKDSAWKHFSAVGEWRQFGQPLYGKYTDPDLNYQFNGGLQIGF